MILTILFSQTEVLLKRKIQIEWKIIYKEIDIEKIILQKEIYHLERR